MSVNRYTCARCCLPQVGEDKLGGFCVSCSIEMRESKRQVERDAKAENMRELYEAGRIELGVALCEKVAAEKEVERLRAALVESRGIMLTIAEYVGDADRSGLDEAAGEITRILNPTKPHAGEERDDE